MNSTAKSALVASAMLATTALISGQAAATEDKFYIKSVVFLGSGCTAADSALDLSPAGDPKPEQFTLFFANYIVTQGKGTGPADWRKNCNINVNLHVPHGWRFSIAQVHYQGHAYLPKYVSGTQTSTYQFVFFSNRVRLSSTFWGPLLDKDYEFTDNLPFTSLVWSPCGIDVPLNIATQIYLSGPRQIDASLTTDQIDGRVSQVYKFIWQPCYT